MRLFGSLITSVRPNQHWTSCLSEFTRKYLSLVQRVIENAKAGKSLDFEHRLLLTDGSVKHWDVCSESSEAAEFHLQKLGVEIHLGHAVEKIDSEGVIVAGERIASKTVIWTAGVTPSPAGKWLEVEIRRAGRVRIQPDLRVPNHPEIFVIGDTASLDQDGKPLAGVAQVAMQQGRYAGKLIRRQLTGKRPPKFFPLLRQRHHGRGRQGLRSSAKRENSSARSLRVARVGFHSHHVSVAAQSENQRVPAMGLGVPDRTTRFASHRELSAF